MTRMCAKMADAKYIVYLEDENYTEVAVIFSNRVIHLDMARDMSVGARVSSAGFVRFKDGKAEAYGRSDSMRIVSKETDTALINKKLGLED